MMVRLSREANLFQAVVFCATALAAFALTPLQVRADASGGLESKIIIAGKTTPVAVEPYRDSRGTVWSSIDVVQALDANFSVSSGGDSVAVTRYGRTDVFPCHEDHGETVVSLNDVVAALGGVLQWDEPSRTAVILARIRMVREDDDRLSVATGFPVAYHVDAVDKPSRVYIDVFGAAMVAGAAAVPVSGDDVEAVRANQIDPTTVRVVVDLKKPLTYRVLNPDGPSRVDIALVPDSAGSGDQPAMHYADDTAASPQAATANPASTTPSPDTDQLTDDSATAHIVDIETDASQAGELQVLITASAAFSQPYHAFSLDGPNRLVFDAPDADFHLTGPLAGSESDSLTLVNAIVKTVRWGLTTSAGGSFAGRVVFDLYHPVLYTVSSSNQTDGSVQYKLILFLNGSTSGPNEANAGGAAPTNPQSVGLPVGPQAVIVQPQANVPNSVLTGKTIVVDPGHGGFDSGAPGAHGLMEKTIALAIGCRLRDQLTACGAKVVMTRADDTFIPLPVRVQMGIENHADYYVSIHADSYGAQNSCDGTSVYYHANLLTCRTLASAIAARLGQLNDGIRDLGTRSDYVRYPGVGYYVLRHSPEPAVLVETGYVNSDHDASALTDPDMQKLIAQGIVAGLKDYISESAHSGSQESPSTSDDGDKLALIHQSAAR